MTTVPNRILTADDPPAVHAQAALDGINAIPETFNMESWMAPMDRDLQRVIVLLPQESPAECGSTLCAAGWVAHNAGYTLKSANSFIQMPDGSQLSIFSVGTELLNLDYEQGHDLFYASASEARYALGLIARGVEPNWSCDSDDSSFDEWLEDNGYAGPAENE